MEVTLGVLADAANKADNGKLNMLGVFQTLYAYEVPARHPQMCLVLVFKASPGEKGTTQRIKVVLMDEDGTQLGAPAEIMLAIPANLPGLVPQFELILNLIDLVFPKFGNYSFEILINDSSKKSVNLTVEPTAPPPAPGEAT